MEMMTMVLNPAEDSVRLCGIMKAIGHPERLAIFRYLSEKNQAATVKEIYETLNLDQPVASRQLGILKNHDLLVRESSHGMVYYRINSLSERVQGFRKCLFG